MLPVLVLVTALGPPPEPNTTNYTLEATAAKAYGVSNYEIVKVEHPSGEEEHEVTLLGSSNEEKGSAHIKETGGIQIITVDEPNLAALTVTFDRGKEQMQLAMGGRTGTARPDRAGRKWVEDPVCAKIKADRITALLLAGAVLDDVVMVPRMKARNPPSSRIDPLGEPTGDDGFAFPVMQSPCGRQCVANDFETSRCFCCNQARLDANFCCWNSNCIGCYCWDRHSYSCGMWGCDSTCFAGDWFCFCMVMGSACSGPV